MTKQYRNIPWSTSWPRDILFAREWLFGQARMMPGKGWARARHARIMLSRHIGIMLSRIGRVGIVLYVECTYCMGLGMGARVGVVRVHLRQGREQMTRKDYVVIAEVFRYQIATFQNRPEALVGIVAAATAMSRALLTASKYDLNGNKSFKPDVFLKACGIG